MQISYLNSDLSLFCSNLLDGEKHYLLEINTLPGLTSTSLLPKSASKIGLDYSNLVDKIIKIALKK